MKKVKIAVVLLLVLAASTIMAGEPYETETLTDIQTINTAGFGSQANKYAFSMAAYDGDLYVGTLNIKRMAGMFKFLTAMNAKRSSNGAEIWRYREGTWTKVVDGGLGSTANIGVRKLFVAKGCLLGVTANHNEGMEVWRTCDGESWEVVADEGFGDKYNTSGRGLGLFKGHIYVGTENRKNGAQLWRSEDGESWEKVATGGIRDKKNVWMSDFAVFKGHMYMGTLNITGGMQAFRTADGVSFERLFKGGIDKKTNFAGMKLYVFKDHLYLTTMDFIQGFDLYRSADGTSFERVLKKGYTTRYNVYLWQMEEYNGRLYAGTYRHSPYLIPTGEFELLSTNDGVNWIVEDDNAFGNDWYYGVRSMSVYDGKLIIGTASARYGCKIIEAKAK